MRIAAFWIATVLIANAADLKVNKIGSPVVFTGMCDASAAVFDQGQVLVLNDEDQDLPMLRFFDPSHGGAPARAVKLSTIGLDIQMKKPEIDFEASALIGNRFYVAGSHSRNKNGKVRVSRQQIFALEWPIRGDSVRVSGRPYTSLLTDLQAFLKTSKVPALAKLLLDPEMAPKEGGVNIEGMSAMPSGDLLLGFRSPLIGGKAMTVVLKRPADVTSGKPAQFGAIPLLDLDGNGIRDVIWHPALSLYLIVGGPSKTTGNFGLYRWKGGDDKPVLVQRLGKKQLGLDQDLKAEALAVAPDGRNVWVFFDEGDRMLNNVECKASDSKSFHGVELIF